MANSTKNVLAAWLASRLPTELQTWLNGKLTELPAQDLPKLQLSLAIVARRLGKAPLDLSPQELRAANAAREGWNPSAWTLADAGRILVLLSYEQESDNFGETFQHLCRHADFAELISLYRGLPLYPSSAALDWQIGEGLRTSIQTVFEAIAYDNPLPAEQFDDHRWNHMILKALFIGATLPPIMGLDRRRNPQLAAILVDHVHERWAAGRSVDLHVWRCIAPFSDDAIRADLAKLAESANPAERSAAALCLLERPAPWSEELIAVLAPEVALIRSNQLSWDNLAA
jgi:hypothetical protein